MSLSETSAAYAFQMSGPDVLERGRAQSVSMTAKYQGSLVAPDSGTFSLLGPDGTAHVDAQAVTIASSVATYSVPASALPATLSLGRLYQQKWALVFGSETRTVVRGCSVALRQMVLPVADDDLTGEYPDLLVQMGDYATTLGGFIAIAKTDFLRELDKTGPWADIIVGGSALYEVIRQRALYHCFKFLFRKSSGDNRFERLMDDHEDKWRAEQQTLVASFDRNGDGLADDTRKRLAQRPISVGGAPRDRMPFNSRLGSRCRRNWW